MSLGAHAVWVLILVVGGAGFGLTPRTGEIPGGGSMSCGTAWLSTDTVGPCVSVVAGPMQGSVLLLVGAGLTFVGLVVRALR